MASISKVTQDNVDTKQHTHVVANAVGKHTTNANRQAKLNVVARSVRGVQRNCALQGLAGTGIAKGKGKNKGLFVVAKVNSQRKVTRQTTKVIMWQGKAVQNIGQLTYGQWVQAVQQTLGK